MWNFLYLLSACRFCSDNILFTPSFSLYSPKSLPKMYETVFIEVDKSVFKTKRNVIIGELYRPPSSQLKNFNKELEKLLNTIKKKKMHS